MELQVGGDSYEGKMNGTSTPTSKLAVPKAAREVAGAVIGAVVLMAFLVSSIFLAVYNLLHLQGIIPSLIWLSLVGLIVYGLYKAGIKNVAVIIFGAYSRKQFVQAMPHEGGQNEIQHGFEFFGRRFLYFTVTMDKIVQIDWHTGQASDLAGKDMNDWRVALWYEHRDPGKSEKQRRWRHPDWSVHCLGPTGSKEKIDAFGHALVDFLRDSGVSLQGAGDCIYVRSGCES